MTLAPAAPSARHQVDLFPERAVVPASAQREAERPDAYGAALNRASTRR